MAPESVKRKFAQVLDGLSSLHKTAHMHRTSDLLTTAQVAERLGLSVPTVNRYALAGRLPVAQKLPGFRGAYLFTLEAVEAFQAAQQPVAEATA
jgi:excisionase family DNA binding protein